MRARVVFSFILLIIFFSSIILYLAFRIKEAFREEQRRSVLLVKIVLLVGALSSWWDLILLR